MHKFQLIITLIIWIFYNIEKVIRLVRVEAPGQPTRVLNPKI